MTTAPSDHLGRLLAHCPEMLFIATPDGSIEHTSAALRRAVGFDAGLPGQGARLNSLVHPDDQRLFDEAWSRLARGAGETGAEADPAPIECRLRTTEGPFQVFSVALRRASGGDSGAETDVVYGSLRPMAERAPRILKEQILDAFNEHITVVMWAVDLAGTFIYQEGKGLAAAGMRPKQLIGKNIFDVYGHRSESMAGLRRCFKGEVVRTTGTSHDVWWENWYVPSWDEQGTINGAFGLSMDVTESKRAADELRSKLELIQKQQQVIRSLTTPVLQVWDDVLTMPMVGMVDSARAAEVMDKLLQEVTRTRARYAILDITGVEAMDTATASHLIRLVRALRLLGAEGIITGIHPAIAQTMVGIGVDLSSITTLGNLRDALKICMVRARANGLAREAGDRPW